MNRKNLESITINFCHSFQSFDYRISQHPLLIELSSLYREQGVNSVEIDILNKTVKPETALRAEIIQRIQNYAGWLPGLSASQA